MKVLKTNELIEKKSRFISFYFEIENKNDVKKILKQLKKEHKKARHIVYAYKLNDYYKKNDAGEPKGTAGMPVLNVILNNNLNNVLIVVIRYYGGIKLGAGPLGRAYSKSASMLI